MERRKAAGIELEEEIEPSGVDLRIGRTIFVHPMPYDLHLQIATALGGPPEPLFVLTENRKEADLWMRGNVRYAERAAAPDGIVKLWRQLTASVVIVARGDSQPLWFGDAKGYSVGEGEMDQKPGEDIAKALVKKLRKALRGK
jgi:hypothetical protein